MSAEALKARIAILNEILQTNSESYQKLAVMRKNGMRGTMPNDEEVKWLIRELLSLLGFQESAVTEWLEMDTELLEKTGEVLEVETAPKKEEDSLDEVEVDATVATGNSPEGTDKIKQLLGQI